MKHEEVMRHFEKATHLNEKGDYIKALELLDDLISVLREDKNPCFLYNEQGIVFMRLALASHETDMETVYLLGAVGCVSEYTLLLEFCARLFQLLARKLGSVLYYKKGLRKAKHKLSLSSLPQPDNGSDFAAPKIPVECSLENLIREAESMIAESKTRSIKKYAPPEVFDSKKGPEPRREDRVGELRSYWMGLDVKVKRDFMKVSIEKLSSFVRGVNKSKGVDVLKHVLAIAREHKKWTVWVCRTKCDKVCFSAEECRTHLEEKHAAGLEKDLVKRIGRNWAHKIKVGGWEPVDTVAAVEMINTQLEDVKAFTSESRKKGWSNQWPLVVDEKRSGLLKEVKLLLVSLWEHQILSCSIRDWVMRFPVKHLGKLEVSEESINDCHIVETPQSICFLERDELSQIRAFLKTITCERHDGTEQVCRGVDSVLDRSQVKETIEFDEQFSLMLLDKRLLKSNNAAPFDGGDDGKIKLIKDPDVHYAKAHAQGDDIISWLGDCSAVDKSFPKPIREHNLETWMAVLRAVQYTCKLLRTKYAKKENVLQYEAALTFAENLCRLEGERRKIVQKDQWKSYASLLCDRCEERVPKEKNSLTARLFLCAVRDVFEGGWDPTFDLEDCMRRIRKGKGLGDDIVLKYIELLKSAVPEKVLRIDAKILLIDNSRIRLLDKLTRLSAFDNRSYMLQLLKPFLLNEILDMESKAKIDAAEADLLLEEEKKSLKEEKKSQAKKMKKDKSIKNQIVNMESKSKSDAKTKKTSKSIKITSTSMASPLEHKPSVDLEPGGTSQSPKTMEEDSMEPKDALESEKGPLEIPSTDDIQEEPTKVNACDMQNMPGEDSVSGNLESALGGTATRYNSALDMTLKALVNINVLKEQVLKYNKQPVHDRLEEQVLCALQRLFTAVVSEEIKTEGVYSLILRDLLVSLEEIDSMSSGAAEVLVTILEFWHCWKNSEEESLVNRLFTLEEKERMSCRKCRRKPNYPEQSSYGIVVAADSVRNVKCAFGDIKFVDILKETRMNYKMLCDIKTGGCGTTNFVHHVIDRCPPIFIIVLEWEKGETEEEISETAKALEWEIDISRLYKGLEPNTTYRLVSMVGYGEEDEEHICMAYEKNRWVNLRRESLVEEVVGNTWKNVVRFCGERKVRPVILLYEAA